MTAGKCNGGPDGRQSQKLGIIAGEEVSPAV